VTPHLTKKLAFVPLIAAIGGLLYLPFSGRNDLGQMEVQEIAGHVQVVRSGQALDVDGKLDLRVGDLIRTAADGTARLRLTGKRTAWVDASSSVLIGGGRALTSRSGSLLVRTEGGALNVSVGDVQAASNSGVFRVDQGFGSVKTSSYGGEWHLSAPGQAALRLPYLFEASITAGRLPRASHPYRLQTRGDLWEGEFLSDVLQLDEDLDGLAAALSTQLGSSRPGLGYFSSVAGRNVGFMRPYMKRPTADLLIGFTVAQTSHQETIATRMKRAFSLADDGGSWGVIAKILRARETVLVSQLDRLIVGTGIISDGGGGDSQPVFALAEPAGGSGDPGNAPVPTLVLGDNGTTSELPSTEPVVQPTPGTNPGPGPGNGGGGEDPNGNGEDPGDEPQCDNDADCAAQEVIDKLPHASPSPSPDIPHIGPGG
jgi:hypothetical protein